MKEFYFEDIDSTQDYAKKIYLENEKEFIVYADRQSLGRGRNGRKWVSPDGGLWFSFDMKFVDIGGLFTMAIGVAIRDILEKIYSGEIKLKWPNDIIFNRKKVGGIICEKINDRVIIGIGLNTNVKSIEEENAETFFNCTGIEVNNYEIMKRIVNHCKEVVKFREKDIVKMFRENMAYRGEICFVSAIKQNVKVLDIADNGYLIVEGDNGIEEVFAGEISVCI